ncbi:protein kinase [Psychrobacillus sp. FSL W7-1457]|uniref:protein kinase n=1 Tax=unclassified Psychrobacillus TaxID=2636677 RepID=UPI0030F61593
MKIKDIYIELCVEDNFIGIGSTRKVYKYNDMVIKRFLHPIGYKQGINEQYMYDFLEKESLAEHVAKVTYLDEQILIQPYFKPLPLENGCSYELDLIHDSRLTDDLKHAIHLIDSKLDGFDFLDSRNYGLNDKGNLILIDYGMTKQLYENEWVPLAESGILPQIFYNQCVICGLKKELRMYGDGDSDHRCIECGKE